MTDWLSQSVWVLSGFCIGAILISGIAVAIVQAMRRQWQHTQEKITATNEELQRLLGQAKDQIHYLEKESPDLRATNSPHHRVFGRKKKCFIENKKSHNETEFKQLAHDIMSQARSAAGKRK